MSTATLLLRLAGPMQSWGSRSNWDIRDTGRVPTKSAVVGLAAAALGRPRDADLSDLVGLRMGVRTDAPGETVMDYQTTLGVPNTKGRNPSTVVSQRWYLADAAFLVGLEGMRSFLEELEAAFERPVWFLALGRKAFVPTPPVSLGLRDLSVGDALRAEPWLLDHPASAHAASPLARRLRVDPLVLGCTFETTLDDAHEQVRDVPVSFESRSFAYRFVRYETVELFASGDDR